LVKFRLGDTLDIKLVISHENVGIKDLHVFFVHTEDNTAHIYFGLQGREGKDYPLPPSEQTTLRWEKILDEDQKPGVYTLDTLNFKTFEDATLEVADSVELSQFEVVPAHENVPDVEDVPEGAPKVIDAPIVVE